MEGYKNSLKLMLISDAHDEDYYIRKILEIYKQKNQKGGNEGYDAMVILGDFTTRRTSVEEYLGDLDNVLLIPGNNEDKGIIEEYEKLGIIIHEKRKVINGYPIIGFGYSNPTPFNTPGEIEEKEILEHMRTLPINENTILLTHAPPYGVFDNIGDKHVGSKAIRKIIDEKAPFMHAFGHIHETKGVERINNKTTVVKVPPLMNGWYVDVEIRDKRVDVAFINKWGR